MANLRRGAGKAFSDAELEAAISRFVTETSSGSNSGDYTARRAGVMRCEEATHLPSQPLLRSPFGGWTRIPKLILDRRAG
jgi:hypothetical protein